MSSADLLAIARICDAATPDQEGVEGVDWLGAHAEEALSEFPALASPCRDCAFVAGTEANLHPITGPAALHCVERSHPFWCHKSRDTLNMSTHLCAGWVNGLRARASQEPDNAG